MRLLTTLVALFALTIGVFQLEQERAGIPRETAQVGTTPVTIYGAGPGPAVVIAHGFAGSRQLMEGYALTLARAGYYAVSFDFEGHGRNPIPMSGDVTQIDGTTRLLMDETRRVIDFARTLPGVDGRIALLGHSMATDVITRVAVADKIPTVVGISMFSEAVSSTEPARLLMISGQAEGHLRDAALNAVSLVGPGDEGETVTQGSTIRRAVVAPGVEHVGVLYSQTAKREALAWINAAFNRDITPPVAATGAWILLTLAGIVALGWPLARAVPHGAAPPAVPARTFWLATLVPALVTPLILAPFELRFLPVLVADYLAVHAAVYGLLTLAILRMGGVRLTGARMLPFALLLCWGLVLFGGFLDRYVASFFPTGPRIAIIAAISFGTILALLAEATLTQAGSASFTRKTAARISFLGSLAIATALDFERLFFLLLILPLIGLFYASFGVMGGWVGRRSGAVVAVGAGLGLCLGWALGVSFPMFDAG